MDVKPIDYDDLHSRLMRITEAQELMFSHPNAFVRMAEVAAQWASLTHLSTEDAFRILELAGRISEDGCPASAILDKLKDLAPGLDDQSKKSIEQSFSAFAENILLRRFGKDRRYAQANMEDVRRLLSLAIFKVWEANGFSDDIKHSFMWTSEPGTYGDTLTCRIDYPVALETP